MNDDLNKIVLVTIQLSLEKIPGPDAPEIGTTELAFSLPADEAASALEELAEWCDEGKAFAYMQQKTAELSFGAGQWIENQRQELPKGTAKITE